MSRIVDYGKDIFNKDANPILLGLLGDTRVWKSPSPRMHLNAINTLQLRGYYVPLEIDYSYLPKLLPTLYELGFLGLNVTAPLKEKIIPHLLELSPTAERIGAVNTLIRSKKGGFIGTNTDAPGFSSAYLSDLTGDKALVLGAGGASRAVITALMAENFTPVISARAPKKASVLAKEFNIQSLAWEGIEEPFSLIINTTGASSIDDLNPLPKKLTLKKYMAKVVDLNYGRKNNFFQKLASDSNAIFQDGLTMLAHQARLSFRAWIDNATIVPLEPFLEAAILK
jgi:shikimate dehydrogenase